jgi:hypothetical protein
MELCFGKIVFTGNTPGARSPVHAPSVFISDPGIDTDDVDTDDTDDTDGSTMESYNSNLPPSVSHQSGSGSVK